MKLKQLALKITKIPLPLKLSFLIVLLLLVFFTQNIILELSLFIFCLIFMLKIGSAVALDIDPVPFSALIILYLYDASSAFYFMLLALPVIDIVSGRFNQYSFVNITSLSITIALFWIFLPQSLALIYGILIFNTIRILLNLAAGFGPQSVLFSVLHAFIYSILGSILSFFI